MLNSVWEETLSHCTIVDYRMRVWCDVSWGVQKMGSVGGSNPSLREQAVKGALSIFLSHHGAKSFACSVGATNLQPLSNYSCLDSVLLE